MTPATQKATPAAPGIQLGLRQNLAQFILLVSVNALVGGMLGQERTVVPLLGERVFGVRGYTAGLTFILVFGVAKATTNYFAGTWSDRFGRKPVLVAGWLIAVPVPLLLIWAPSWAWVVVANVLLGVSQGLTWSTTVIMKIDLVGPKRRGFAMGLNEAAGYGAVAVTALATGYLADAYGLRPAPFLLGIAFAALGLGLSTLAVRETRGHARLEAATHVGRADGKHEHLHGELSNGQVFVQTSFKEPALSSASQAGLVNNLNDGLGLGAVPDPVRRSRPLGGEDRRPRRPLPRGLGPRDSSSPGPCRTGSDASGSSRAACGCRPSPWRSLRRSTLSAGGRSRRSSSAPEPRWSTPRCWPRSATSRTPPGGPGQVGIYRLWRDGGFAVGALLAGIVADALGIRAAVWTVAALTSASGLVVAVRMYETHHRPGHDTAKGEVDG
jgi:MFS family permease